MGPNGSGKSTLAPRPHGQARLPGARRERDPRRPGPPGPGRRGERARLGLFLAPQYPTEVPGVRPAGGAGRGAGRRAAGCRDDRAPARPAPGRRPRPHGSGSNRGCSSGRSTSTCPAASASAARRCSWPCCGRASPCSTSSTRASTSTGCATWPAASAPAVDEWGLGVLAITHYRRLLVGAAARRRARARARPHRRQRGARAGRRARAHRVRRYLCPGMPWPIRLRCADPGSPTPSEGPRLRRRRPEGIGPRIHSHLQG